MNRPNFITTDQIDRWNIAVDNDPLLPDGFKKLPRLREVIYAGFWLVETLRELNASEEHIFQLKFYHGQSSFGRDCWEVAQNLIEMYESGEIEFEPDILDD